MLFDLYNIAIAAVRLRAQNLGNLGWKLFFTYAKLRIKNRWFLWTKQNPTSETILDFKVHFTKYSTFVYLFEEIFVQAVYHFKSSRPDPVIFDCGSNIGLAVLYFKTHYPLSKITAFEPSRDTFALLKTNVETNHLSNVTIHNVALSDNEGFTQFHCEQSGSVSASLMSEREQVGNESETVRCARLSSFITEPLDFLKMDIEGAEALCIPEIAQNGGLKLIWQMAIEVHHNLIAAKQTLTTVLSPLEANAFTYHVSSSLKLPVVKIIGQDVMIYAHQNIERSTT